MKRPVVFRRARHRSWLVPGLVLLVLLGACTAPPATRLPKHARARLGQGLYNAMALSPDGQQIAIGTSLGLGLYRAGSFAEE
jgi:hypothetical protein